MPILFDERRRGLQDMLAGTVVVYAPKTDVLASRRADASVPWAEPTTGDRVDGVLDRCGWICDEGRFGASAAPQDVAHLADVAGEDERDAVAPEVVGQLFEHPSRGRR